MNLSELSKTLEYVYNGLGNAYLTKNYETSPFKFSVEVKAAYDDWYYDYIVEIYTDRDFPGMFRYKPEVLDKKEKNSYGVTLDKVKTEFKRMISYVDITRAGRCEVEFMGVKK